MGRFSNGTEADRYQGQNCFHCDRWRDAEDETHGCPVWTMHALHAYEKDKSSQAMLDEMIPMTEDGFSDACAFFVREHPAPPLMTWMERDAVKHQRRLFDADPAEADAEWMIETLERIAEEATNTGD